MQLFGLDVGAGQSSGSCKPAWAVQEMPCPYGHLSGPPQSHYTMPKDSPTWLDYVAAFYSWAPFVLAIGFPLAFLWTRGTREILGICHFWLVCLLMVVLKAIIGLPRPAGSCLTSCGMPSGHTMQSMAFFTWLLLEVFASKKMSTLGKGMHLLVGGILLLPVGWSRTQLSDHSWAQVIVGGAVGIVWTLGWFWLLRQRVTYWFLKMICANITFLTRNYPPDGVEEEAPWAAGGSGVPGAAAAAAGGRASKPKPYGSTSDSFPGSG
mmetsp:Transcript_52071/g.151306  ORF Transcript_52071/g.151306 Transcript_52071/m.151306 type:complete len:265 (+) Transcript_52071:88-882(+)